MTTGVAHTTADTTGAAAQWAAAQLEGEAAAVLREFAPHNGAATRAAVAALARRELWADAVRLLAHALPAREGVWWAWWCARRAVGPAPEPPVAAALAAVEGWIAQPTDEHRRIAMAAAEAAGLGTAAGCAGLAAFFGAGSIAPLGAPDTPPPPFLGAKAVAGGVTLAAVSPPPAGAPERFRMFVDQGLEVGRRIGLWPAA